MTVEASLVLPIFIFAMSLIAYMSTLMIYEDQVQWALTRTCREASAMYGATKNKVYQSLAYYQGMTSLYLKDSSVKVLLTGSEIMKENDEIHLVAKYYVQLPFGLLPTKRLLFQEDVYTRAFVGVETREKSEEKDVIVYITETGQVYHRKENCTYLKLSISQVKYADLVSLRNSSGGKYKECEKCCKNKAFQNTSDVWITNYGDRYHSAVSCSGLKRYIREIKLSEVGKRTACSKCG